MALVVEVLGWAGRARQYFVINAPVVNIGRSYDNDVVINDQHVSPHHLQLERERGGWRLIDLNSVNGVQVLKNPSGNPTLVASGAEIKLGRTRLRLLAPDEGVEEAKPLHIMDRAVLKLGSPFIWVPLYLAVLFSGVASLYLHSVTRWEWTAVAYTIISGQLVIFGLAAVWGVIGRIVRHEGHFFAHLSVILLNSLLYEFSNWALRVIGYNAGSPQFVDLVAPSVGLIILCWMLLGNLALATNLSSRPRWVTAVSISVFVLVIGLAEAMQQWGDFSSFPRYFGELEPPPLLFVEGQDPERYVEDIGGIFYDANKLARENTE